MARQWRGPGAGYPAEGDPVAGTVRRAPARWPAGRAALWRATPFWKGSVRDPYRVSSAHLAPHRHHVARLPPHLAPPWRPAARPRPPPAPPARRAPLNFSTTCPNSRTLLQAVDPPALTRVDRSPTKIDAPTGGASVGTAPSTRCWTEISASAGGAPSAYKISTPPSSRSGTSAPIPVTVVE